MVKESNSMRINSDTLAKVSFQKILGISKIQTVVNFFDTPELRRRDGHNVTLLFR